MPASAVLVSCAILSGAADLTIGDPGALAEGGPGDVDGSLGAADALAPADGEANDASDADATMDGEGGRPFCDEPGLLARWTFDEGSGADVLDCTRFHHDGRVDGGMWTAGERDGGMAFDGGWVGFGNPADLQLTGPLSACAWVLLTTAPRPEPARGYVVSKMANPVVAGWRVAVAPGLPTTTGSVSANVPFDGGQGVTRGGTLPIGAWTHICMVYQSTAQVIYVGGAEVARDDTPFPKITVSNDELRIGTRADGTNPFIGVVDDVRLYSRALTPIEIAALAQP